MTRNTARSTELEKITVRLDLHQRVSNGSDGHSWLRDVVRRRRQGQIDEIFLGVKVNEYSILMLVWR